MLILALCGACTPNPTAVELTPRPRSPTAGARFVGTWLLDQPYHAGYEANLYTFHPDGTLQIQDTSWSFPCDPGLVSHCITGTVGRCPVVEEFEQCQAELRCEFGDRWTAIDDVTLIVSGVCSDGQDREIELLVPQIDTPVEPLVLTVGGEPGWDHDWWTWAFTRCANADGSGCSALQ